MGSPANPSTVPPEGAKAISLPPAAGAIAPEDPRVPLRLTVTRGVLGMELYEPIDVGPITVVRLALALPNLKFPLDLSGGVPQFRHRRGELDHVELRASLDSLGRFADRRFKDVLGPLVRPVLVWGREQSLGVGLVGETSALSFELLWVPEQADARWVVHNARSVGLSGPALAYALRALDTALPGVGKRRGRMLVLEAAGAALGRALLPAVGARAPSAEHVRFGELRIAGDEVTVELDAAFAPAAIAADATRALELAELVADADEALARGDLDAARAGYLAGLERAPRHPELVRLIAEIDLGVGERAEAALGMIVESMPATRAGLTGAELLAKLGDFDGARQAVLEATQSEMFAPLAALMFCRMAALDPSPVERMLALDRAVALSPGLAYPRGQRFEARVARGDALGALGDAEHLEAIERGAVARHAVNLRSARALFAAGFMPEAQRLFERALRYVPDDAGATAGLARALVQAGRRERAATLLSRAVTLSERKGRPDAHALIDLALLLAGELKDLPQAIARIRQVSASSDRVVEARFREARWRADLGDVTGASLAFARMREAIELGAAASAKAPEYLSEAAEFEQQAEGDPVAAERHLALALRLAPHDSKLAELYRTAAGRVAEHLRRSRERGSRP